MLFDIGGWLQGIFGPYGELGILLLIFFVFFIDALFFPTLPELFFVIGFMTNPSFEFGCELLLAAILAELIGISLLYYIVEKVKVPKRIRDLADRYINFLVLGDERLLLINRVAPMIPFAGAFISLADWRLSRSLFYVLIGCILKYGAIMLMSSFFYTYFSDGAAQMYTIIFIIAVIAVSVAFALIRKRRLGIENS
ncbi:MAG: hypothetical protein FWD37_02835 [Methanomassiliicoccaceae archaeon]|nr:hypothetical protein [Methanomassiliicoccaceae archaeon]